VHRHISSLKRLITLSYASLFSRKGKNPLNPHNGDLSNENHNGFKIFKRINALGAKSMIFESLFSLSLINIVDHIMPNEISTPFKLQTPYSPYYSITSNSLSIFSYQILPPTIYLLHQKKLEGPQINDKELPPKSKRKQLRKS
jgi:hypothetical protein